MAVYITVATLSIQTPLSVHQYVAFHGLLHASPGQY